MAGTINLLAGAAAEVLPSPVGASLNRSATRRAESHSAPVTPLPRQPVESPSEQRAQVSSYPTPIPERAQTDGLAKRTTLTFERDLDNGKMYLYIKDKRTGEEVLRIPSKILKTVNPQADTGHRVDVRI